ncbi:MAG: uracil phosphoribosyltransferase [Candidatus Sumerlaeota bacterium]|nr:uracil phosphoribosyltransferase [Candidatus Sumerlaeota bacterium]
MEIGLPGARAGRSSGAPHSTHPKSPLMPVHVVKHPVVTHKMSILRDKATTVQRFREVVSEMTLLLSYEATRDLDLRPCVVETPLMPMDTFTLTGEDFVIAPILRAGLGMVNGMLKVFPEAKLAHIGMRRDEETALPATYYENIPSPLGASTVILVDPMLATGGSLSAGLHLLRSKRPKVLKAICLIAAPEGKARIERDHPDVDVYVGALDDRLNERSYILPGLGDAGDRMFGTL